MMTVVPQLAHSLGRRDETPNQDLAKVIANNRNEKAVKELVAGLHHKVKGIRHDCIKVLYEIGRIRAALVVNYLPEFLALLTSRNNRMQWGAMCALDSLSMQYPEKLYSALPQIIDAADNGSVITRDHAVSILANLAAVSDFSNDAFELLVAQLRTCPGNQLPMYAERAAAVVSKQNREILLATLRGRLPEMETAAKTKRIEMVIKKISAINK